MAQTDDLTPSNDTTELEDSTAPDSIADVEPEDNVVGTGEPSDEASAPLRSSVKKTASRVAGSVSSAVKQALVARDHVLMVRINDESLERINDLKDAGLFRSRSEAAAYLIAEGIDARAELFDRISDRIQQIQRIKSELRSLAGDTDIPPSEESDGDLNDR